MNYTAEIRDLPHCTVYYKQGTIKSFAEIPEFILKSAEECNAKNPDIRCTDYCYTAYLEPCDVLPDRRQKPSGSKNKAQSLLSVFCTKATMQDLVRRISLHLLPNTAMKSRHHHENSTFMVSGTEKTLTTG